MITSVQVDDKESLNAALRLWLLETLTPDEQELWLALLELPSHKGGRVQMDIKPEEGFSFTLIFSTRGKTEHFDLDSRRSNEAPKYVQRMLSQIIHASAFDLGRA